MGLAGGYSIPSHVLTREVGGEVMILDMRTGLYFNLDAVGARIWRLLADGHPAASIVTALAEAYEAPRGAIERDVASLLAELRQRELIIAE